MNNDEMQKSIDEMPANQWFSLEDITGGAHDAGLWMHLCHMDDGNHTRNDGALFIANTVRLSFMWKKQ